MAKESVVSSLLVLFGSTAALTAALTPAQAAPLLVFCLLYTPCIAAVFQNTATATRRTSKAHSHATAH